MHKKWLLIPVASVGFALLLTLGLLLNMVPQETASGEVSSSAAGHQLLESLNAALVEVAATARASVVNISTTVKVDSAEGLQPGQDPFWDLWEEFFGRPRRREPRRQQPERREGPRGSGFIFKEDGYILTNHHVIDGAEKIKVTLDDKREFNAQLVGTDKDTEVAVIKIDAKNLPAIKLGDSDKLQVGEMVLAIGNPFGLSHTVTNGIVSATGRSNIEGLDTVTYQDFIQTDAPINPGNSGGPLVNIRGEVVGINTAIALATTASGMPIRGNVGVGFAVPISMALSVMDQLMEKGKVERGWLGIGFQPVTPDIAEKYGLKEPIGALIVSVKADGPADKAGIKVGDLMVEFDGESLKDGKHLMKLVAKAGPGKRVDVKVIRDGKEKKVGIRLTERTEEVLAEFGSEQGRPRGQDEEEWLGITVQDLSEDLAQQLGYEDQKGVLVSSVDPEGPAAEVNDPPRNGDLIQEIEFKEIKNMNDYRKVKKEVEGKDSVMVRLRRPGRGPWYMVIKKK